jgi:hypothetical protein
MLAAAAEIGIKEYLANKSAPLGDVLRDAPSPPINKLVAALAAH